VEVPRDTFYVRSPRGRDAPRDDQETIEMPAKKNTPTETTPARRDRSTKQVEKVYTAERGVGRVYKETSGRYVSQARRVAGGGRTRRRFDTLKAAKEDFAGAVLVCALPAEKSKS
jgi:hypothetical protein